MKSPAPQNRAIAQMLLCAVLWSIAGIFIKHIPWHPMVIAGFRSLFSALVMFVYMKVKQVPIRPTRGAVISGLLLCLTFFAFVAANKLTTAANAIVLQFTAPVFLLLYSALIFRRRLRLGDVLAVAATLAGISLFFLDELAPGYLLGNLVAILSGAFMGGMYLAVGQGEETRRLNGVLLGQVFTAAVGIPVALFVPTPMTGEAVLNVIILGVVQLGIPYLLLALAIGSCPPLACSLLGAAEPLLNPVWVFLFAGEAPGPFALVGGGIVVAAVTCYCVWRDRGAVKQPKCSPVAMEAENQPEPAGK